MTIIKRKINKFIVVPNSGGYETTDWVDSNLDGLADSWAALAGDFTLTIVTGNGFTGNAQRLEANSLNSLNGIYNNGIMFTTGNSYKVTFKYRTNNAFRLLNSGGQNIVTLSANTGDATYFEATFTAIVNGQLRVYINNNNAGDWAEIDEINVYDTTYHSVMKRVVATPIIILNGGGFNTTDWIDSNADGLANYWTVTIGVGSYSIVTGNGFSGNAQRVSDYVSGDWFGIHPYNTGFIIGGKYKIKFKYRCNYPLLVVSDSSLSLIPELAINEGDAIQVSYEFEMLSTTYINFRNKDISSSYWFEIDEVNLYDLNTYKVHKQILPRNGLLAEYTFDGNVLDTSGNGNDATIVNGTFQDIVNTSRDNIYNEAVKGNIISGVYITTPINIDDSNGGKTTFSFWAKPDPDDPYSNEVSGQNCFGSSNSVAFWIKLDPTLNYVKIRLYDLTTILDLNYVPIDNILEWNHYIVYIHYNNTVSVYQNNQLLDTKAAIIANNLVSKSIRMLSRSTAVSPVLLDDVRIYNRELTANEIKLLYQNSVFPRGRIIITNCGGYNTTDWIDSNSDGLADLWSGGGTIHSIVTGNGFNGNAQHIERDSTTIATSFFLSTAVFDPSRAIIYKVTFKYRSDGTFSLYGWSSIKGESSIVPANTGDAKYFELTGYIGSDGYPLGLYLYSSSTALWVEIDEINVYRLY